MTGAPDIEEVPEVLRSVLGVRCSDVGQPGHSDLGSAELTRLANPIVQGVGLSRRMKEDSADVEWRLAQVLVLELGVGRRCWCRRPS